MELPLLAKLLISLLLIIIVNRITRNLFAALLCGAVLFSFWSGQGLAGTMQIAVERTLDTSNITLLGIVALVIILSGQMGRTGLMESMVTSMKAKISTKASMAVLPAIIGLLPMPGGALFSAPLLDTFDDTEGVNQHIKTTINYWFRHIWEYGWPLYPAVILAADIAGVSLLTFAAFGAVPMVLSVLFGYLLFLRTIPRGHHAKDPSHRISLTPLVPVTVVVAGYAAIQTLFPELSQTNQYLPMFISLCAAIIVLQRISPLDQASWKSLIWSRKLAANILVIYMVRIYGAYIEADIMGSSVAQIMTAELAEFGIPPLSLIMILPFVAGLTMGVSIGFVGSTMPVVVALLGSDPAAGILMGHVVLAYVCGFMGTILSPLHVCLIVTCEYYKTQLAGILWEIFPAAVLMTLSGLVYRYLIILLF